jgi:hypothetical protein
VAATITALQNAGALLVDEVGQHGRLAVAGGGAGEEHVGTAVTRAGPRDARVTAGEVAKQTRPLHGPVDPTRDRDLRSRHGERTAQVCHTGESNQTG